MTKISPAQAMHYAELVGQMPPRYIRGKLTYGYIVEGEYYTVDVESDYIPSDMNKVWGEEVNEGARQQVFNTPDDAYQNMLDMVHG